MAAAWASTGQLKREPAPVVSAVDCFESAIREELEATPTMPAMVIAEPVGWDQGMSAFTARVRELRPFYLPPDPSSRTTYRPGERMQCDLWFPPADIPSRAGQVGSPPVPVMTAGHSRVLDAVMIPTHTREDLVAGHSELLAQFRRCPGSWFGIRKARRVSGGEASRRWLRRSRRPRHAAHLGAVCRARHRHAKGLVERNNDYCEHSFLPGRMFTSPADFNTQISGWIANRADVRHHRVLGCQHIARWATDETAMLTLPPDTPCWIGACRCACPGIATCAWTSTTTRSTRG